MRLFLVTLLLLPVQQIRSQVFFWEREGVPVNTSAGLQRSPILTSDGAGGAIIAWEDLGSSGMRILAQRVDVNGKLKWQTAGVVLCAAAGSKSLGSIVSDGSGGAIVTWSDNRNGNDYDVYAQRVDSTGSVRWTPDGVPIVAVNGDQTIARMVSDQTGGAIIVWDDKRSQNDADIYAQRIDHGGVALWQGNGLRVTSAPNDQVSPQVDEDGAGGVVIVWLDKRRNEDIYAQRLDRNGRALWASAGLAVCDDLMRQTKPHVAATGNASWIVVWEDYRALSGSSDLYYQKIASNGQLHLPANGVPLAQGRNDQTHVALISDGIGGAICAWTDYRSGTASSDLYARRIDDLGVAQWKVTGADSLNGLAICTTTDTQELATAMDDGAGGALFVWQDRRATTDFDIAIQSTYSSGAMRWTTNGIPLFRAERNQINVKMVRSLPGSAILVWTDGRVLDGSADIYAQRIGITPIPLDSVSFDTVQYSERKEKRIVLKNEGNEPLPISTISLTSAQSTDFLLLNHPAIPFTMFPGDSVSIEVAFMPRTAGYRWTNLRIVYNTAGSQHLIRLSGTGVQPNFTSFPTRVDFGTRKVGQPVDTVLGGILKNIGFGPLTIHTLRFDGLSVSSFELLNPPLLPVIVAQGDSIGLTVRFMSRFNGFQSAFLTMISNGSSSTRTLYLNGNGVYSTGTISPATLVFDSSDGLPQTRYVTIKSTGTVPLQVLSAESGGSNRRDFNSPANFPIEVQAGDSVLVPVQFIPLNNGVRAGYIRFVTDQATPSLFVQVMGIGYGIISAVEPASESLPVSIGTVFPQPIRASDVSANFVVQSSERALIRTTVFNLLGKEIFTNDPMECQRGLSVLSIPVAILTRGTYFVRMTITAGNERLYSVLRKIVLLD